MGQPVSSATGTLRAVPAAIRLDFDPTATFFGLTVRLETLALAGAILIVLVLAVLGAGRAQRRVDRLAESDETVPAAKSAHQPPRLRPDDLLLIAFGTLPGAVVGGRADYVLIHLDYYLANPSAILDPTQGGMGLTLAVLLGAAGAVAVARLLAAPIGRWLEVAAGPVLIGLGLGKLAGVLGGTGQGVYSGASWATYYARTGVWESSNPSYPALPSQALEGVLVLLVAVLMLLVPFLLRLRLRARGGIFRPGLAPRRDWAAFSGGRRFLTAIGLWAGVRIAVAVTWRDAKVLGPLGAEQLLLIAVLLACLIGPEVPTFVRWLRAALTAEVRAWRVRRAAFKAREAAELAELAVAKAARAAAIDEANATREAAAESAVTTEATATAVAAPATAPESAQVAATAPEPGPEPAQAAASALAQAPGGGSAETLPDAAGADTATNAASAGQSVQE